jgi:hypothetical protein
MHAGSRSCKQKLPESALD